MPDVFTREKRREVMSRIRSKHTKPEDALARILDLLGVRYERYAKICGHTVDFWLPDHNTVIEYRSCFWHFCPLHGRIPETNRDFWEKKLRRNRERDRELERRLEEAGIRLVVIWEHDADPAKAEPLIRARLMRHGEGARPV